MLKYAFHSDAIEIEETADGEDREFRIRVIRPDPYLARLKAVQRYFEDNDDYTDVLFYAYPNHEYRIIVHRDHYADFLCELFKHRLLRSLEWSKEA